MRINHKVYLVILSSICLAFFSQIAFAQNTAEVKSEIYSKLECCLCREPFNKCTCPEAKEIKAYVEALLESGKNKEDIFYKIAKKFSLRIIKDEQIRQDMENRLIQEAGNNRPQIFLESISFDFGNVSKKQGKISKAFKLSNKGNSPLVIKNIKTTCPCSSVTLKTNKTKSPYFGIEGSPKDWQSEIKPGGSGELELTVDLASPHVKIGKLIRDALLISNDPVYPEVIVKVKAEVKD